MSKHFARIAFRISAKITEVARQIMVACYLSVVLFLVFVIMPRNFQGKCSNIAS